MMDKVDLSAFSLVLTGIGAEVLSVHVVKCSLGCPLYCLNVYYIKIEGVNLYISFILAQFWFRRFDSAI